MTTDAPTRMQAIKDKYDRFELGYEDALAQLEALGMWEGDADNYLAQRLTPASS